MNTEKIICPGSSSDAATPTAKIAYSVLSTKREKSSGPDALKIMQSL
jgi:hypothetical protein